jgi:hypothetical protein
MQKLISTCLLLKIFSFTFRLKYLFTKRATQNKGRIRSTLLLASSSTSANHLNMLQINIDKALAQANAKRFDSQSIVKKSAKVASIV